MILYEGANPRAEEIAGIGEYTQILETLRREDLLQAEVERVRSAYALYELDFVTEEDAVMFTILDLYDPGTAKHCYETYRIAKAKIEKEIFPGVSLAKLIENREGISLNQFYRACLLHDIGKIEVPRGVIRHHMGDGAMLGCMHAVYHSLYLEGKIPNSFGLTEDATDDAIDEAMQAHHARAIYFVPASEALKDQPEILAEIRRFGFTDEETLMQIIQTHELRSGNILTQAGFSVEAYLAAHHHNYANERLTYAIAVGALHISISLEDMMHMADVTQAILSNERSYKEALRMPKAMRVIVEHVKDGKVPSAAAYLWLTDDLQEYEAKLRKEGDEQIEEDADDISIVREFLAGAEEEVGGWQKED